MARMMKLWIWAMLRPITDAPPSTPGYLSAPGGRRLCTLFADSTRRPFAGSEQWCQALSQKYVNRNRYMAAETIMQPSGRRFAHSPVRP